MTDRADWQAQPRPDPAAEGPLLEIRGLRVDFPDVAGSRPSTAWT